jgi:hypothetical protein
MSKKDLIAFIESNSIPEPNTGCLIWEKSCSTFGYGYIRINKKTKNTHRVIFEEYYGEINSKEVVMHKCDTPSCNNINHLTKGTHKENSIDMVRKGRNRNGNENKTHCKNGHQLIIKNSKSYRSCKECINKNKKQYYLKNKSELYKIHKEYMKTYRLKNRDEIRLKKSKWRVDRKKMGLKVT